MKTLISMAFFVGLASYAGAAPKAAPPKPGASPSAPRLWASLSPDRAVYEELGPPVVLSMALVNDGPGALDPQLEESRLLIDGREAAYWKPNSGLSFEFGSGPAKSPSLQAGRSVEASCELGHLFQKPGVYRVRWVGKLFASSELKVRVLPPPPPRDKSQNSTRALLRAVRKQLSPGWAAFYAEALPRIEVVRLAPLRMARPSEINGPGFSNEPRDYETQFRLALFVDPFVSPERYAHFTSDNLRIDRELLALARSMNGIRHKFDSYIARTPQEEAQVNAYNALKKTRHALPDFYFGNISLSWIGPYSWGQEKEFERISDESQKRECRAVTEKVTGLFSRYPPTPDEE